MRCLLVIDFQVGLAEKAVQEIFQNVELLVHAFDQKDFCVFTKLINSEKSYFSKKLNWHRMTTKEEQELIIEPGTSDIVLRKELYSAYCPELERILINHAVKEIVLCGLDSDACIMATAFDLFDAGFNVKIASDACSSSGGKQIDDAAKLIMARSFGRANMVTTSSLI